MKYQSQKFRGGENRSGIKLIVKNDKIYIPEQLQKRVVEWYHVQLNHPGFTQTEETLRQQYTWKNMHGAIWSICRKCDRWQRTKVHHIKYGFLPEKEAECVPWQKLCVDLIGPYTIRIQRPGQKEKELTLHCVTMIDPATCWFEIKQILDKCADTVADVVEKTWLTRYP